MYDPATGQHEVIRVPARSFGEEVTLRLLPVMFWLSQYIDFDLGGGEGASLPVPYGIDIAPNGDVWFSQLNANRIGRIDPDTFELTMIDTPFTAPRRMRFDSQGNLWIPGFSSNLLSRFDPRTGEFKSYPLPIEPLGTETPYALNVERDTDTVWICGTNSDTLISFDTASEQFTVYPLPTQVTYTRDIDFDDEGGVWTSNSNAPTWQIETGIPRVLRLLPGKDPELSMGVSDLR
jgi:streptogramin lyase